MITGLAHEEFEKFRKEMDQKQVSDFDQLVEQAKKKGEK